MKILAVARLIRAGSIFMGTAFLLVSCASSQIQEETLPAPVQIAAVSIRETAEEVKGFGSLSFIRKFEIVTSIDGILDTLCFREGDAVNKGDLIGIIKNPQVSLAARRAEDAYAQALAALDLVQARLRDGEFYSEGRLLSNEKTMEELAQAKKIFEEERRKSQNRETLYEAGGLSDEAIREERFRLASAENQLLIMEKELEIQRIGLREEDLAAAGYTVPANKDELWKALIRMATSALRAEAEAARANLEAASREMESCRLMEDELLIRSPGQGIIGARFMEEGERIRREDRLLTIMDTTSLYAFFPVPEGEAPKIKKGMPAKVSSGGDKIYEGKVDLVSPQADSQSFTFMVRILIETGNDCPVKPGMFARVSIPLESPKKITIIPETALNAKRDNFGRVFTVRGNTLSERVVVLGALMGDEREIVSGLNPGEVVVLNPNPAFREGAYVSVAE